MCIAFAAGGAFIVLPAQQITLGWTHTVEQTRWEEDYATSRDGLTITEARIEAYGAGMEAPASAIRDGRWSRYRPALPVLKEVTLANSRFAAGHSVCWDNQCRPLRMIVPQGQQVTITYASCAKATRDFPGAAGRNHGDE